MMLNNRFAGIQNRMPEYLNQLENCEPTGRNGVTALCRERCPTNRGIYVFYENGYAMYVGRSDNLNNRILEHGRPSSDKDVAACASNIARKFTTVRFKTNRPKFRSMPENELQKRIQKALRDDRNLKRIFNDHFERAKECVSKMQVRVVEIKDPIEQAIFEIYAHVELETPYNDFRNH